MKQLEETNISSICVRIAREKYSIDWGHQFTIPVFKTIIEGMALYLNSIKKKGQTMGCKITVTQKDTHTEVFVIGAYVESTTSEDGENSFTLTYTVNEDDMNFIPRENIFGLNDVTFKYRLLDLGFEKYGYSLNVVNERSFTNEVYATAISACVEYLKANVDIDPELELKDFFIARIDRGENDTYNISITPSALVKQHIKDDTVNEIK